MTNRLVRGAVSLLEGMKLLPAGIARKLKVGRQRRKRIRRARADLRDVPEPAM
jgi:hypothetical protein